MQARVSLCVSELVSNAVRHAGGGMLRVSVRSEPTTVLEVEMEDNGPGIALPELALHDGFSQGRFIAPDDPPRARRGLGTGLGALARWSSEFHLTQREAGGTRIRLHFRASDRR
jgi:serine/threonine-protein kinase RsbT